MKPIRPGHPLPGQRHEVPHRQRQRGEHGVGVRQVRRGRRNSARKPAPTTRSSSPTAAARSTSSSTTSCTCSYMCRRSRCDNYPVRDEDILHTASRPSPPHSTPSTSASSTCAAARSACPSTRSTRRSPTPTTILYGNRVTDFSHVRANFVEAYADPRDETVQPAQRRLPQREPRGPSLLLFNPLTKSKVTMEGER